MRDSEKSLVLAVDGGGTRCRLALSDGSDRIVVEGGPANVTTDFKAATECIQDGLDRLRAKSGLDAETFQALPAFIGLAGVAGREIADQLEAALPLQNATYRDDRPAALRGAFGRQDGVLAHCGTGSFFGAQFRGRMTLAGGWGPVLGDEASAQWVGRQALSQMLVCVDGHQPMSPLAEYLLGRFQGAAGVVRFASQASPGELGALAPFVTKYASDGDVIACAIMEDAASIVATMLNWMGWLRGVALCLTGGIAPHYRTYLPPEMQLDIATPMGEPLDGALALALERQVEAAHERC